MRAIPSRSSRIEAIPGTFVIVNTTPFPRVVLFHGFLDSVHMCPAHLRILHPPGAYSVVGMVCSP